MCISVFGPPQLGSHDHRFIGLHCALVEACPPMSISCTLFWVQAHGFNNMALKDDTPIVLC